MMVRSNVAVWSTVVYDDQGPLRFIRANNGPERGIGHFRMIWDTELQNAVGTTTCGNGEGLPCPVVGRVRHAGNRFNDLPGLPLTARGDVAGPVGGFGWVVEFDAGPPKQIDFEHIEVLPETPMLVSILYPIGTRFTISAHANPRCKESTAFSCTETFRAVDSLDQVRFGPGNEYHVDSLGLVTFRIVQTPHRFIGQPDWFIPSRDDLAVDGPTSALDQFARAGVFLPQHSTSTFYRLLADCEGSGAYCVDSATADQYRTDVCAPGYEQTAYDRCCSIDDISECTFANGSAARLDLTPVQRTPASGSPSPSSSPSGSSVTAGSSAPSGSSPYSGSSSPSGSSLPHSGSSPPSRSSAQSVSPAQSASSSPSGSSPPHSESSPYSGSSPPFGSSAQSGSPAHSVSSSLSGSYSPHSGSSSPFLARQVLLITILLVVCAVL